MRINFDGSIRDVLKIIDSSAKPAQEAGEFGPLLQGLAPEAPQIAEIKTKNATESGSKAELGAEPRASFRLPEPQLLGPEIEPFSFPEAQKSLVKETPASVKSPTILSARRIPEAEAFQRLGQQDRIQAVRHMVQEAGIKHGVDPVLSMAVVSAESDFNSTAVSSDGHFSKGLMQLLDGTGQTLHTRAGSKGQYQPFNPQLNIDLGVSYLRHLHDIFSQATTLPRNASTTPAANSSSLEKLALAAYNAGEGRVASAQSRAAGLGKDPGEYVQVEPYLPESTQEYVRKVSALKGQFEAQFIG